MDETRPSPVLPRGLSSAEAARRLEQHGTNALPARAARTVASRVGDQLRDPMIVLLLAAAAVTVAVGDVADTVVIALVVVLNSTIGVVQEVRADRAVAELDRLAAPVARVVRDGAVVERPGPDLVPDDVVLVEAGDVVPADAAVTESYGLQVDESAMTGESQPVDRGAAEELFSGTVVTRGRAVLTVVRTGAASGLGQIAQLVAQAGVAATPLQRRLRRLSRELVVIVVVASVVVFALGLTRGRSVTQMLLTAVSLSVAAVPESLPAVVSVALALGAHRMARRSALVRRLPAVETLGSVTVLASDKTGTLTEGQMVATAAWTPPGTSYDVTGTGYAPTGAIAPAGADAALSRLLRDAVLCNDARLVPPGTDDNETWLVSGDPLEGALLALAAKGGVESERARADWPRRAEAPFEAERGWMRTVHESRDGVGLTVVTGAPEAVLALLPASGCAAAREATRRLAERGCRVLALADAAGSGPLELAGLVGVTDPPRTASRAVVQACRDAGIRVVLVTGDHPVTARVIAAQVGICPSEAPVLTGEDVAAGRHGDGLDEVGVYARIRPEQKVRIVRDLQDRGHVVAMTGDGVNDAPALRTADIGVAMGRGGTEVARQAADLVLADDDLHTVVAAVEEGRRVFANIRSFLRYAVSGGVAEILVMLMGPFLGVALPLLPAQILWVNMLTHGLPGVAFGGEPVDPRTMRQPSRSPRESVLGGGLGLQVAGVGALIATVSTLAGFGAEWRGLHVQTAIFVTLGTAQLGVALALRVRVPRGWRQRGLEAAVAGAAMLQLAGVYWAPLQRVLGTESLPLTALLQAVGLAAAPGVLLWLVTLVSAPRPRARRRRRGDLRH
ncbi:MAG: cation-translocating P-type ATPase [Nocardioidaceae bacterium]